MTQQPIGKVLSIAVRTAQRGAMKEVPHASARVDGGLEGDIAVSASRGVSFISAEQWRQVTRELGANLAWHTRRANVLVETASLGHLVGKTVRVGEVELEITDETRPCALMDQLHQGLRAALVPDCRGGVHGRVLRAGRIQVGDTLTFADTGA